MSQRSWNETLSASSAWLAQAWNDVWRARIPPLCCQLQATRKIPGETALHICYTKVKDSHLLAGVIYKVTKEWDVPLMLTRGYASLSYLFEAADTIDSYGKPAYLYCFGDYDPSGLDINRSTETRLREFAPDAEIHFERVAVTAEQIALWSLPTRPTKKTDSRSKNFSGESVEVDAIEPDALRALVKQCIEHHVNQHALNLLKLAERSEREIMLKLANQIAG